jgi:hypothetical protein
MIETTSFDFLVSQKDVSIFFVTLRDINIELLKKNKSITNSKTIISLEYHDFLNVFSKEKANEMSSHRKHNHSIQLKSEIENLTHASLYNMSEAKLILIKRYLENNLDKEFIQTSSVSFVSSVLFAKKSNDELRFCVNYRKLNVITKKNRYSLSLISKLMTRLSKAKYMIKINIRHAFNRIRMIISADEDLITFRTRFDLYKYLVLSFELINESATF